MLNRKCIIGCAFVQMFFLELCSGQLELLNSFHPTASGNTLCGIAYDPDLTQIWVYGCNFINITSYDTTGNVVTSFPAPGGFANDVDLEISPVPFQLKDKFYPRGQLLLIHGEVVTAKIYVIDNLTGAVLDTFDTGFGASHVVGGAYHPDRNTFFLIQDNVPAPAIGNTIAEIHPVTGETLQTFQITQSSSFNVSFGDLDIAANGNLFLVSSIQNSMAEFTPTGSFVQTHALPQGVSLLSGLAIDCDAGEAWVANTTPGDVHRIGNFPCGTTSTKSPLGSSFLQYDAFPNPFNSDIEITIQVNQPTYVNISIVNMYGERIHTFQNEVSPEGLNTFSIETTSWIPGVYVVHAETNSFRASKLIVCAK